MYDLFDRYNVEDCKIELLAEAPCESREHLRKIEGEYIRRETCINKRVAGRTDKEYYQDNKERLLSEYKEYRKTHKEEMAQQQKEYYRQNKERRNQQSKSYREHNLAKCKVMANQYYLNNRMTILQRLYETEVCKYCNTASSRHHIARHQKSKYCEEFQNISKQ